MTDVRLYLTIGIPTLAVLIGILIDVVHHSAINARFDNLELRFERTSRI